MLGKIYLITNLVDGKKYVGQTVKPIEKRLKEHFKAAFVENRRAIICSAIRKYGKDSFSIECLQDNISIDNLDAAEQYWIKYCDTFGKNGYNATTGGNQCRISDETKLKISIALMGHPVSEESRKKMSESQKGKVGALNSFYGRTHSEETIAQIKKTLTGKMSGEKNPFYGKHHSEESKKKLSESLKGKNIGVKAGIKHHNARLIESEVLEIRKLALEGYLHLELAKMFRVARQTITKIVNRRIWRHI